MNVSIRVTGVPKIIKKLGWKPAHVQKLAKALKRVGEQILDDADAHVPIKYGNLQASGKVKGPVSTQFGYGAIVIVEYGGGAARGKPFPAPQVLLGGVVDYAILVHEVTARSGDLKWLQNAFNQNVNQVKTEIGKELKALFDNL